MVNSHTGWRSHLHCIQARTEVQKALEAAGLYRGLEPHEMSISVCSRSGDVLEPMLKPQVRQLLLAVQTRPRPSHVARALGAAVVCEVR